MCIFIYVYISRSMIYGWPLIPLQRLCGKARLVRGGLKILLMAVWDQYLVFAEIHDWQKGGQDPSINCFWQIFSKGVTVRNLITSQRDQIRLAYLALLHVLCFSCIFSTFIMIINYCDGMTITHSTALHVSTSSSFWLWDSLVILPSDFGTEFLRQTVLYVSFKMWNWPFS